jgi:hypothetical protein
MRRAAVWGWAAALMGGCEQPRTELVVRVDSEIDWGANQPVQSVTLSVRRGGPSGPLRSARTTTLGTAAGRQALPLYVGVIAAANDTDAPVWIEVLGCGDPNGCSSASAAVVVAQRAVVTFVRGRTQELPMLLASDCRAVMCAPDQRCFHTQCEAATEAQATVRPFQGNQVTPGSDAGGDPVDAELPADRPGADVPVVGDAGPGADTGACGTAVRPCCAGAMCEAGFTCMAGLCTATCGLGEGATCTPDAGASGCCADGRSCARAGSGNRCCNSSGGTCTPSIPGSTGCCGSLVCRNSRCVSCITVGLICPSNAACCSGRCLGGSCGP